MSYRQDTFLGVQHCSLNLSPFCQHLSTYLLLPYPVPFPGLGSTISLYFNLPHRVRVRYQKRQKLQFETKLGMNSPF